MVVDVAVVNVCDDGCVTDRYFILILMSLNSELLHGWTRTLSSAD